jgi:SAM-dependent methyltransferase
MKTRLLLAIMGLALASHTARAQQPAPSAPPATGIRPPAPTHAEEIAQERQRWNRVLTDSATRARMLNEKPNALLVETVKGRKPGTALDVGMGEGRNAIYLAQQGWQVTGFDVADQALAFAQKRAKALNVKITTVEQDVDQFDWGTKKWDLIVVSYAGGRDYAERVKKALKPGGLLVLEGFHRDAIQQARIGEGVVFSTDEMKKLYADAGLKILRYEEPMGVADFSKKEVRLVRLVAQKP